MNAIKNPFAVLTTVELGSGYCIQDLGAMLIDLGHQMMGAVRGVLQNPPFQPSETMEVDLVSVSVADLGLEDGVSREVAYGRAQELGLKTCPHDAAPMLRLKYHNQPNGETLIVATEPLGDATDPKLFAVARGAHGDSYLAFLRTGGKFKKSDRLVFIQPRT